MPEPTQKTFPVATVAVVAAVVAVAALVVGSVALIRLGRLTVRFDQLLLKVGRLTSDDQPITIGGGSLHLNPATGWTRFTENTGTHTATAVQIRSADYTSLDWACNTNDATTITPWALAIGAGVTLLYRDGNDKHSVTFTRSARNEITLSVVGNLNGVPMLRHLIGLGAHGKKNWRVDTIKSSDNGTTISCNPSNDEFFLQFR